MNDSLLRSGESHQFENYWRQVWPRSGMPSSDQLDFSRLGPLEDFFVTGRYTSGDKPTLILTSVGAGITGFLNADVTGSEYFATVRGEDLDLIHRVYDALVAVPCGRWRIMHYDYERKGIRLPVDSTVFPYRSAETGEVMVGALIVPLDDSAPSGVAGRALTAVAGKTAQWINMGQGVPADPMLT